MSNKAGGLDVFSKGIDKSKISTKGVSPLSYVPISKVFANENQPRKKFENIDELAVSIKEQGLINPITVVKRNKGYMIIAGERRYKAVLSLNKKLIQAYIVEKTEEEIKLISFIENEQREDLTAIEKAKFLVELLKYYPLAKDLAKKIGKSETYISKCRSVVGMPEEIFETVDKYNQEIGVENLHQLKGLPNIHLQKQAIIEKHTTTQIRKTIKELSPTPVKEEQVKIVLFVKSQANWKSGAMELITENKSETIIIVSDDLEIGKKYKVTIEEVK